MSKIYVIHENDAWVEPLRAAFRELDIAYAEWFLSEGSIDFSAAPPQGVFYNRMSASSHTRGHRYAPELTAAVLAWLESYGRRVINNSRALQLELSKLDQYASLKRYGIRTPRTIGAVGRDNIVAAAKDFTGSFITKHNRAGKGLGVRLFHSVDALQEYVHSDAFEDSVDGITLVQEYIRAPEPYITRVEFVGGELLYAVRVDTSLGFELCPADVCQVGDAFCPVGQTAAVSNTSVSSAPRFQILQDFARPTKSGEARSLINRYRQFIADNGIRIAGIEFITDAAGEVYTYDINTNTNYNPAAEAEAQIYGMRAIARYLGDELNRISAVERRSPALAASA